MKIIFTLFLLFILQDVHAAAAAASACAGEEVWKKYPKIIHLIASYADLAEAKVLYGSVGERRQKSLLIRFLASPKDVLALNFTVINFDGKSKKLPEEFSFIGKGRPPLMIMNPSSKHIEDWKVINQADYMEIRAEDGILDSLQGAFETGRLSNLKAIKITESFEIKDDIEIEKIKKFLKTPLCSRLTSLDLAGNAIGDEGAKALAGSDNLSRLTSLDLAGNAIGAEGAKALAGLENLSSLTSLDLGSNEDAEEESDGSDSGLED